MRVPVSWLNEFLRRSLTPREIDDLLGEAGVAVTGAETPGVLSPRVLVGRVEPDPPDRAGTVMVALPGREPVRLPSSQVPPAGALVAVALVGARLFAPTGTVPGGLRRVGPASAPGRGVGVLCGEADLGVGPGTDPLLLPEGAPLGVPVSVVLPTEHAEEVLNVRIPDSLPHCRGLWGLAQEVNHRLGEHGARLPAPPADAGSPRLDPPRLLVSAPEVAACAALLGGLRPDALPDPDWHRPGLAGLSAAPGVEQALLIAGYEYGVRLAAYWVPAGVPVTVRLGPASAEPRAVAVGDLDGTSVLLSPGPLDRPREGDRLLLLAAGPADLSPGGERCRRAVARAARLLTGDGRGTAVGHHGPVFGPERPRRTILVDLTEVRRMSGTALDAPGCARLLRTIDGRCAVRGADLLAVAVPPSRPDLRDDQDMAAELVRLLGFREVPSSLPTDPVVPGSDRRGRRLELIRRTLAAAHCRELVTPLVGEPSEPAPLGTAGWLDPGVSLAGPEGSAARMLRRSLVPGLARAEAACGAFAEPCTLFELGSVVLPGPNGAAAVRERTSLALLASVAPGPAGLWPSGWEAHYGELLESCRAVARALEVGGLRATPTEDPAFHPGTAALLLVGAIEVGRLGALRPDLPGLPQSPDLALIAAELDVDRLLDLPERPVPVAAPPRFPVAQRDVSLLVPDPLPLADLLAALRETGPPLREAELADVYRDPRTSRRAVTVRLTLGSDLRTLERQEVARAVDGVMAAARRTGARPR